MTRPAIHPEPAPERILIVIPCLNEAAHIGALLRWLQSREQLRAARIVVADGGSRDGTQAIVEAIAARDPRILLLDNNAKRIQSAAVNLAVKRFGASADYLIRIDAHGQYPDDYCEQILADAIAHDADSVVVSMLTEGRRLVQRAVAAAQNSILGTGGSRHRHGSRGAWVDHGHHALMRLSAFRAVGGYDEAFSHNEDAELDHRLRQAGCRIWLTGNTRMTYFPRASLAALYRQYLGYGRGRAANLIKHGTVPKPRQMAPLLVAPAVALLLLSPFLLIGAVPFMVWALLCLGAGLAIALRKGEPALALAGISAMVMHFAWSFGFWRELLRFPRDRRPA